MGAVRENSTLKQANVETDKNPNIVIKSRKCQGPKDSQW